MAGPYRAPSAFVPGQQDAFGIHENVTNAMRLALEVWRLGAAAICPHGNSFCFQNAAADHVWLDGDLELLSRADAALMTPDWRRSSGATAEHEHARSKCIPVFYWLCDLKLWLGTP